MSTLKFCTVCAANQNRSMEAHRVLKEAGYNVNSYGTGSAVRLPGSSIDKPNIYKFGTPYDQIYKELSKQNQRLYIQNGVLKMLDRNRKIKTAPERFQENNTKTFDVIITCEEKCFDAVIEDLLNKNLNLNQIVHVINVDIKDDTENATIGGKGILNLVNRLAESAKKNQNIAPDSVPFEDTILDILAEWQKDHPNLPLLYSTCFY
ncbi:RNA polymerase II subunit A C-terminal domain phosphatase [Ascoidea rubescens DSM 1968]|uniref:RNA polymerase II subunit A C-terminal domain phosphatase SSU72 n=1 Tax=Ascoidea rubescens DSM 1968 TaxID=1344418 RepID=A0A1D2VBG7_9ASCO|nr:Ssu72-like protein [Ascoidea rubescens DSM 1968]ODV58959.1 Ssu72-like protein [Ascoidea rubescens DSM 1968]